MTLKSFVFAIFTVTNDNNVLLKLCKQNRMPRFWFSYCWLNEIPNINNKLYWWHIIRKWLAVYYQPGHTILIFFVFFFFITEITSSISTCRSHRATDIRLGYQHAPCRAAPQHRSSFMLLFIMVPSNPCLVHYSRAAMYQHLAGGIAGFQITDRVHWAYHVNFIKHSAEL